MYSSCAQAVAVQCHPIVAVSDGVEPRFVCATCNICLQEPLPAAVELPVLTRGDKLSQSVIHQVTAAAPVATEGSTPGTASLTVMNVIQQLFYVDQGQLTLSGVSGLQESAAAPAIDQMEAAGAHYSTDGAILYDMLCYCCMIYLYTRKGSDRGKSSKHNHVCCCMMYVLINQEMLCEEQLECAASVAK